MLKVVLILVLVLLQIHGIHSLVPEQIHLALGKTPDTMAVQWATTDEFCTQRSLVQYGLNPSELTDQVEASCYQFSLPAMFKQSNHVAYMTGLKASTKYFYRVGEEAVNGDWSQVFFFQSTPDASTVLQSPQKFMIFGDLAASSSGPDHTTTITPYAVADIAQGNFDMIYQLGDFAYNFASKGGLTGRQFMNEIQNMAAYVPFMVNHGNHESAFRFAHYTEFFRSQPTNDVDTTVVTDMGVAPNNWYFSWNVGLVHFVTLSSEVYFMGYDTPNTESDLPAKQFAWLEQDLQAANANRTAAPWVVVTAHRSIYCSCDGDCDGQALTLRAGIQFPDGSHRYGLESLFYKYGVDLYLNGHEHNYERMFDVAPHETYDWTAGVTTGSTFNPPATTYIVTGDAGNNENHEPFTLEQPARSAYRTDAYGYSRMTVYNATHLFWEQVQCDLSEEPVLLGVVVDSTWIVQEYHGSFEDVARKKNRFSSPSSSSH